MPASSGVPESLTRGTPVPSGQRGVVPDSMAAPAESPFADQFLRLLGSAGQGGSSGIRILDVGTGLARIPVSICRRCRNATAVAVDLSSSLLARARREVAAARLARRVELCRADAVSLPFADGTFDAVISNGVLHHLRDPKSGLREMTRVLKPSGVLFVRNTLRQRDFDRVSTILAGCRAAESAGEPPPGRPLPAAWTLSEARGLAGLAGIPPEYVRQSGPRHWIIAARLGATGTVETLEAAT